MFLKLPKICEVSAKDLIFQKLEDFIKKFYTNELLKGLLFFIGLGLLYFFTTLFIEYFFWLPPFGRTILFWLFLFVEVFLLARYIVFPIFKLLKIKKGINYNDASQIIGNHFSEVGDKLTNFLQLSQDSHQSELLLASIEQKATTLSPVPFSKAINYKKNNKYIPLAALPLLLLLYLYLSNNQEIITQSFNRVVKYNERFSPPAPFEFILLNKNLVTQQNKDFTVLFKTDGKIIPENVKIFINDESYFMKSVKPGFFEFTFTSPNKNTPFYLKANEINSDSYELFVNEVPSISNFEMVLNFPQYTKKQNEIIKGTGNAIVPEGTKITWKVNTVATKEIKWDALSFSFPFVKQENNFIFSKTILQNTEYQIRTSNDKIKNYEKLNYQINIIKDQYPTITITSPPDNIKQSQNVLVGQVSDDYGLTKLQLIYYPKENQKAQKKAILNINKEQFDQFVYTFPNGLSLEEGVVYEYYFEVFDNDVINNFKSTKSEVFSTRLATEEEKEDAQLQNQNQSINSLQKTIKAQDKQLSELEKLQKLGKEKEVLEFKDKQKINDFIKRQKEQEEMMKEFSKKLEKNLDSFKSDKKDEFKDELKNRIEKIEKESEKNEKLLEELQKLQDKISQEDFFEKMDKLKQNSKNQSKNLEQLVELTKKYYVEKKAEQIANKLDKLAEKQEELSNDEKQNTSDKQQEINDAFKKIQEELNQLQKDNKELKTPLEIPNTQNEEKSIEQDLNKATQDLKQQQQSKAKPKQKSASQKMKQMSGAMMEQMGGGEMEQLEEDTKMLRQVLDNLLAFSFSQENVMNNFKGLKRGAPAFNKNLKTQQDLKQQFKHIDDSLFAMSLRNPKLGEDVTKEIGNVHYNVEKAIENLVDVQVNKGISHQQYTITASNKLADLLSDILNSMQMSLQGMGQGMPKPGKGQSSGMQLPDIIQKQQGLGEKMQQAMKKGEKEGEGSPGDKKGDKEGGKEKGNKKGSQKGNGESGEGESGNDGEQSAKELMEIYKEQRRLREQLQNALEKQGLTPSGQKVLDQMKDAEKQILNKGFKNEVFQKVLNIKYEMLKLEKALQQQGQDNKRESTTNEKKFQNTAPSLSKEMQEYLKSVEILNRQTLPLRKNYNQKVQEYFKND